MLVNELRIGNIIKTYTGSVVTVTALNGDEINNIHYTPDIIGAIMGNVCEGIPLTEEWLLKLGFKHKPNKTSNGFGVIIYEIRDEEFVHLYNDRFTYKGVEMKHVHQLQNLYFATTGKELTCL
jgi:hypothetical protein